MVSLRNTNSFRKLVREKLNNFFFNFVLFSQRLGQDPAIIKS